MSTIQPIDSEDVFLWPDGTHRTRGEYCDHCDGWKGGDFEIVPYGTARYDAVMLQVGDDSASIETSEADARPFDVNKQTFDMAHGS